MIAKRAQVLRPSPTLALAALARELQSSGKDVVSLTIGEPDWRTYMAPEKAGIEAIQSGFTKYTAPQGIVELRQEIARQTSQNLKVNYSANDVVVGTGAKYILYAGLQLLVDPGDEVLIPSPYWVSYPTMAELAGAEVKVLKCDEKSNFKLTPEILEKGISPRSKILILCSPSNPTGMIYTREELSELAQVLKRHPHVAIISDDIYNRLVFNDKKASHILEVAPDLASRTLIVNGASKSYAMTGWRIGWGLGPSAWMKLMSDFVSQTTSNPCSISQRAALAALQNCEGDIQKTIHQLQAKRDRLISGLRDISGFQIYTPDGAFYLWLGVSPFLKGTTKTSKDLANYLLEKFLLATVPGSEFGVEGYLRLSFTVSDQDIDKAIARLRDFSRTSV